MCLHAALLTTLEILSQTEEQSQKPPRTSDLILSDYLPRYRLDPALHTAIKTVPHAHNPSQLMLISYIQSDPRDSWIEPPPAVDTVDKAALFTRLNWHWTRGIRVWYMGPPNKKDRCFGQARSRRSILSYTLAPGRPVPRNRRASRRLEQLRRITNIPMVYRRGPKNHQRGHEVRIVGTCRLTSIRRFGGHRMADQQH